MILVDILSYNLTNVLMFTTPLMALYNAYI